MREHQGQNLSFTVNFEGLGHKTLAKMMHFSP
jgi:hypothetical protein